MEDAFFSQLDGNAVRELLLRTELRHAALFAVSDTLRIERCSDAAQQLSGLHPMEELDPFLSGSTRNILLRCINTQSACTAEEDIDGTVYTVEMIPHRGGALLAYLRRDRAAVRPLQSQQNAQQRRLADARIADDARQPNGRSKGQAIQHRSAVIILFEVRYGKLHHTPTLSAILSTAKRNSFSKQADSSTMTAVQAKRSGVSKYTFAV